MVIGDKFIYLELHKTGCTHIRRLFDSLLDVEVVGKHNSLSQVYGNHEREWKGKHIIGSVRNPWAWYVSLWAYGANGRGDLFQRTTKLTKKKLLHLDFFSAKKWQKVYSDPDNPKLFKEWLRMIMQSDNHWLLDDTYHKTKLCPSHGFMTYRFLYLYSSLSKEDLINQSPVIESFDRILAVQTFIKNERLEEDFITSLEKAKQPLEKQKIQIILAAKNNKTNTSKRRPIQEYYDAQTIQLIADKEKYIIEKFGYQVPLGM
jgi:hypothetical protein